MLVCLLRALRWALWHFIDVPPFHGCTGSRGDIGSITSPGELFPCTGTYYRCPIKHEICNISLPWGSWQLLGDILSNKMRGSLPRSRWMSNKSRSSLKWYNGGAWRKESFLLSKSLLCLKQLVVGLADCVDDLCSPSCTVNSCDYSSV